MNPVGPILASVIVPGTLSIAVVLFLRQPLLEILVELCGNAARARFWAVFSLAFIVLASVFGVLTSLPLSEDGLLADYRATVMTLKGIRAGVLGLLMALLGIAFALFGAISKHDEAGVGKPAA